MGYSYWFRVGMMCIALTGVLLTMHKLSGPQRPGSGNALFGMFSSGPSHMTDVNLCPTRVTRLESSKVNVFQEGMEWYRTKIAAADKEHLDPVAVEKWFSRHCAQEGEKTSASADVSAALKVFYVTGEPLTLLKSAGGEFEWMGHPFRSQQMDTALRELEELPPSTKIAK